MATRQSCRLLNKTEITMHSESEPNVSVIQMDSGFKDEDVPPHMVKCGYSDREFLDDDDDDLLSFTQTQMLRITQTKLPDQDEITCVECRVNNDEAMLIECESCKKYHCLECEKLKPTEGEEELIQKTLETVKQNQVLKPLIWRCTRCRIDYPNIISRCDALQYTLTKTISTEEAKQKRQTEKHRKEIEKLKTELIEVRRENTILREKQLIKEKTHEIKRKNEKEVKKDISNEQKEPNNENEIEPNDRNKDKKHTPRETRIDEKPNMEKDEQEREMARILSCRPKTSEMIENKFEVCKDRREYGNEILEVGAQCKKVHIEKKEHEKLLEEEKKIKENEPNLKIQKANAEYCKHHLYNTCTYKGNCWKIHVTLREYRKTIRCRYYEGGRCLKGRFCEFKHLMEAQCKDFIAGNCTRGDTCTYRHLKYLDITPLPKNKKENNQNSREKDLQRVTEEKNTEDETQMNFFPEDTRKVDQTTTTMGITQLMNSEELYIRMEAMMEKIQERKEKEFYIRMEAMMEKIQERKEKREKQEERERTLSASK